ncbi:hypothetical protein MKX01_018979 [Papaver californicum]|nr:hypothetical protein MKX01_018979 [Papaver californicum]
MQTTKILNFSPTFHHPPRSSIIKKPQTHYINNFSTINMITNNNPFFPKICITNNKPFHISSCSKKDNADADSVLEDVPKNSTLTSEKKLRFHVSFAFEPILSAVKWVFSSVTGLVSPCRNSFVLEDDLILFKHNGRKIVGVVQHVVHHHDGLMETTLQSELGLLENFKLSIYDEDGGGDKDILNAHDELQCNSMYNFVVLDSIYPIKILVKSFVTVSKLKTPRFERYIEIRRKELWEIDQIRCKHGGSKEESELLAEIDKIQSK